jgi:hypothetical protein
MAIAADKQNHEALVHIRYRLIGAHYELEAALIEAREASLAELAGLLTEAADAVASLIREVQE